MTWAKTRLHGRRSQRGCDTLFIHPRPSTAFMVPSEPSIFSFTLGNICQVQAASWQYVWIPVDVKVSLNLARILSQSVHCDVSRWVVRVWFFQYSHLSSWFGSNSRSVRQHSLLIYIGKKCQWCVPAQVPVLQSRLAFSLSVLPGHCNNMHMWHALIQACGRSLERLCLKLGVSNRV